MNAVRHLLTDLDATIQQASPERRETTLRHVTDLFVRDVDRLTEEQIAIFDAVIGRLAPAIERGAKAWLARRLASLERAPIGVIRTLARDAIEVARPVLMHSPRLQDGDLVLVAMACSGEHRRAIAMRREVSAAVADALVARGGEAVLRTLAANPGAHPSPGSLAAMVGGARLDEELQVLLFGRTDLPPEQAGRLIDAAQDVARRRLAAATPRDLHALLEEALRRPPKPFRAAAGTLDYRQAMDVIGAIEVSRRIDEEDVAGFAATGNLEHAVCAVAACTGIGLRAAERLFTAADCDLILLVAKAKRWSWPTLSGLLALRDPDSALPHNAGRLARTFADLDPNTADRVLRVVRRRERRAPAGNGGLV